MRKEKNRKSRFSLDKMPIKIVDKIDENQELKVTGGNTEDSDSGELADDLAVSGTMDSPQACSHRSRITGNPRKCPKHKKVVQ